MVLELMSLSHKCFVLNLSGLYLLLNLLEVKRKCLANLTKIVILLCTYLCLHTVFLCSKLHVKLSLSFAEVNLLLGQSDCEAFFLNHDVVKIFIELGSSLPLLVAHVPNLCKFILIHFFLRARGH